MLVDWVNDGNQWYLYTMIPILLISVACIIVYLGANPFWGVVLVFNPFSVLAALLLLLTPIISLGLVLSMLMVYFLLKFVKRFGK